MDELIPRLNQVASRCAELERLLSDEQVLASPQKVQALSREHATLAEVRRQYERWQQINEAIADNTRLIASGREDQDLVEIAREEVHRLTEDRARIEAEIRRLLLPPDKNDERNIIVEIRAGTGGQEAALFVRDLYRMYSRYAEGAGWKVVPMSSHPTDLGGLKEIIFAVEGRDVYRHLRYESGVHRVQRIPATEAGGRIHTSAVSVAVLPEPEPIEVVIADKDIRIDVFRSSGPGGQSVNTMDSAVRITHLPTGIIVQCQDEKSQRRNKEKAMAHLRAKLLDIETSRQTAERSLARRSQIGSGDRSEKIRTYNFPQNRVTDHRIGLTVHNLWAIMEGHLEELVNPLITHHCQQRLQEELAQG